MFRAVIRFRARSPVGTDFKVPALSAVGRRSPCPGTGILVGVDSAATEAGRHHNTGAARVDRNPFRETAILVETGLVGAEVEASPLHSKTGEGTAASSPDPQIGTSGAGLVGVTEASPGEWRLR